MKISLNPCFSGRYAGSCRGLWQIAPTVIVLILVFREDMLGGYSMRQFCAAVNES